MTLCFRRRYLAPLLLLLATTLCAAADPEFDRISNVRHSYQGETLRLVVETGKVPEASVFFATGPERLIVEFNDCLPATDVGSPPKDPMIESWGLKRVSLNRSRLVLHLNFRPPTSEIKVTPLTAPPRLLVEIPTSPELKETFPLTSGVDWVREDTFLDGRWVRLNRLLFDPSDPNVEVSVELAHDKTDSRETVSSLVRRHGALAGINGGFFASNGGALGLVYRDGRLLVPHVSRRPPRSGFGLSSRGKPMIGRLASTGTSIKDLDGGDWTDARFALGGGPRLLQDGKARITAKQEELGPGGNDITRVAARTVVGVTGAGKLVFATVTGFRDNHSQGARFEPVVGWLKSLGVREAVNFDGGASVDMVVGSHIVSDGPGNASREKPVATALLVKDKRDRMYPDQARWSVGQKTLLADGESTSDVEVLVLSPSGKAVPNGTRVRFFGHGLQVEPGLVTTEDGKAKIQVRSVRSPGPARLTMEAGPLRERQEFHLKPGSASRLELSQGTPEKIKEDDGLEMQQVTVKAQLTDRWGNPLGGETVQVMIDGSEPYDFRTDSFGMIALDVKAHLDGGLLELSHLQAGKAVTRIGPFSE